MSIFKMNHKILNLIFCLIDNKTVKSIVPFRDYLNRSRFGRYLANIRNRVPLDRERLAFTYIAGVGIEIGAMHNPTPVPKNATVKYVDNVSSDINKGKFSELSKFELVSPDYIEDGFKLQSIKNQSQDFLIANHVLEHADNALQVLERWAEVIKPEGTIFLAVPICVRCFDKGRQITTIEHFANDYESYKTANGKKFLDDTYHHYLEWVSISEPNQRADKNIGPLTLSQEQLIAKAKDLLDGRIEIHFHTFSVDSFRNFLGYFCENINKEFFIREVLESGIEVIGVISRKSY